MTKRILIVFCTSILIILGGCSNSNKISESKLKSAQTTTELFVETIDERTIVEPTIIQIQSKTSSFEDVENSAFFMINRHRVNMGKYGSIEMPVEWSYMEEPESERPAVYYGDKNNQMIVYNCECGEDIKTCAGVYLKHYENVVMTQTEINGYEVYKISYYHNNKSVNKYIFACADGINRYISFMGDRAIEFSDSIIKTYHLYS